MNQQQYQLMQIVRKIPLFAGLEPPEVVSLLRICRSVAYAEGHTIYPLGGASHEMLILLAGRLGIVGETGEEVAQIKSGGSIGEMGLFTGHPCSASVVALERATGFIITRAELTRVLSANHAMHIRLLNNLVSLLSARLVQADSLIETLQGQVEKEDDDDEEEEEEDEEMDEGGEAEEEEEDEDVDDEEDVED